MLNEIAFSNGFQEGNDHASDTADHRFNLLLFKLGLDSGKYPPIMAYENEEEWPDQVAEMLKSDLKLQEVQDNEALFSYSSMVDRKTCPDCKGTGWFCSAWGQIGCECSSPEDCSRCRGKGYIYF